MISQEPLRTVKAYTQLLARQNQKGEGGVAAETVLTYIEGGVDRDARLDLKSVET